MSVSQILLILLRRSWIVLLALLTTTVRRRSISSRSLKSHGIKVAPPGGAVAQLGERRNRTAEVRGSNPLGSTSLRERNAAKAEGPKPMLGKSGTRPASYN